MRRRDFHRGVLAYGFHNSAPRWQVRNGGTLLTGMDLNVRARWPAASAAKTLTRYQRVGRLAENVAELPVPSVNKLTCRGG